MLTNNMKWRTVLGAFVPLMLIVFNLSNHQSAFVMFVAVNYYLRNRKIFSGNSLIHGSIPVVRMLILILPKIALERSLNTFTLF